MISKFIARLRGDYVGLADRYLAEGKLVRAAEMYDRGGRSLESARVALRAGLVDRALAALEHTDDLLAAGNLLAAEGMHREAVRFFERAGAFWKAAESALQSKQPRRAGPLFEQAGAHERAAEVFEQAGSIEDAIRAWGAAMKTPNGGSGVELLQRAGVRRAKLLAKVSRYDDAAQTLAEVGRYDAAAEMWLRSQHPERGLAALLDAGYARQAGALLTRVRSVEPGLQARILAANGRHAEAAALFLEAGQEAGAAEAFDASGDWGRAAELFERVGDFARAADLYSRSGAEESAGRCYERSGSLAEAAEAYRRAGAPAFAAACYLGLDRPLDAANCFLEAEDRPSAITALRSIGPESPSFAEATLVLAPLLLENNEAAAALDRLDLLVEGEDEELECEREYWRGVALEQLDDLDGAAEALNIVVKLRRDHRDAARRLLGLRSRLGQRRAVTSRPKPLGELERGSRLVDRYEILDEIGRGGMSRVYRALDHQLSERVAVKILFPSMTPSREAERRMINEVQLCRRITHPNVVRIFDFGRFEHGLFVTMELLEGMTLATLIRAEGGLPMARLKTLLAEVVSGLGAAHDLRIIHRDLKPANVAVTPERAKIMDFGIAHAQDSDLGLTRTGQVIGSPLYMSPEQIQGQPLDPRSDLYSFGVLAFTSLVGREPFRAATPTAVSVMHLQEEAPNPCSLRPELEAPWGEFVLRLLQKDREHRYASAAEVLAALHALP